jgi:glycosyltransferase involved in cell wall biosynthesis
MDGGLYGYGVAEFTRMILKGLDRRMVTSVGLFLGRGQDRDYLAPLCDEVYDLGTGCLVPLSLAGRGRFYVPNLLNKGSIFLRAIAATAGAIRRLRLDMVHVQFYPLHLIAGLACRLANVPCIWHWHGPFLKRGLTGAALDLAFGALASRTVCISHFVEGTLPPLAARRACTIHNGVDTADISTNQRRGELRERIGITGDAPLVGLFGAIAPRKGHEYFLRAAAIVLKELPDTRFCIVGGENVVLKSRMGFEAQLRQLSHTLGISKEVVFAGEIPKAALMMSDCDVVCMPTVPSGMDAGEGFGLVMVEAMAAGVPVIASNCGAPPEIIEPGVSGVLVAPRDADSLATALIDLLKDARKRQAMGQAARHRVATHFDIRRTTRALELAYRRLAPRNATQTGPNGAPDTQDCR